MTAFGDVLASAEDLASVYGPPVDAVTNNDLPKVLGVVLIGSIFIILANLVVDLLYAVVDPRVRTS